MRILSITHYSALLGANRSLLHLLAGLKDRHGVELLVLCPKRGAFTEALEKRSIPYQIRPFCNWGYSLRSLGLWLFPWRWLRFKSQLLPELMEEVRAFDPDLIHSNSLLVSLGWQLAEALEKPHVWHLREFGWQDYGIVFPLGPKIMRQKLDKASAIICISKSIAAAHTRGLSQQPYKIFNGIGTESVIQKNGETGRKREPDGCFRFLIIGLLHPSKGQMEAVQAFAKLYQKHPEARLNVVGKGRKLYALRLRLHAYLSGTAEAVTFSGYVADPAAQYANADAVLMCSPNEAMGRVTAEAMSYGKPVIAFNGGATPEILSSGKEGLLYNTPSELAEGMIQLIENPQLAKEMGHRGFLHAMAHFSDEQYVDQCFEVFGRVL